MADERPAAPSGELTGIELIRLARNDRSAAKAVLAAMSTEAQARANQLLAQSITPTLVQYELTKKWNGQMPQVTGGATPLLQLQTTGKP